jgi:hypothetical protein
MEVVPEGSNESKDLKTLFSFYSSYLWNRVVGFFPSSSGSNFLGKISNLCRQAARAGYRSRRKCLPLPLPSNSLDSSLYCSYLFSLLCIVFFFLFSFYDLFGCRENGGREFRGSHFLLFPWLMKNSTKFSSILVLHLIAVRVLSLFVLCQALVTQLWYTFYLFFYFGC